MKEAIRTMQITTVLRKATHILRTRGIAGLWYVVSSRLRSLFGMHAESYQAFENLFRGKKGIEIGGPSSVFSSRGIFPVYPIVEHLDNCNYCDTTVWEGNIKEGKTFQFDSKKKAGRQYIVESTAMGCLSSGTYDFVLSSHVLEHNANPILALSEWIRLLKEQGTLVMLLPHKQNPFDYRRPVTTMAHLISDFNTGMTEDDLTHMPEILALHDLKRDSEAGDLAAFKERSMRNYENRCFHHHVFDTHLVISLVDYMGMQIQAIETIQPTHILLVAQKMKNGMTPNNFDFTYQAAQSRHGILSYQSKTAD